MTPRTAYIVSLKFAPGLWKEFTNIGEKLGSRGLEIHYLLAEGYKSFSNDHDGIEFITKSNSLKDMLVDVMLSLFMKNINKLIDYSNLDFIFYYNPHILNLVIAKKVKKKNDNIRNILYLHEPYKADLKYYTFYRKHLIKLIDLFQNIFMRYIDHVILPSDNAYNIFLSHFKTYKGNIHIAPLMVPDQREIINFKSVRKYFYISFRRVHENNGHNNFIDLVNYVASKGLNYKFALVSSGHIPKIINSISQDGKKIVEIINKKIIYDSEINALMSKSYAVLKLDRESTQSGIIPVAYMNGTPVIARNVPGLSQHVKPGSTGYLVPTDCGISDLLEAMGKVVDNFDSLSLNARQMYEDIWSDNNFDKYYRFLCN